MAGAAAGAISDREAEVLSALGEHLTNVEIASRLFISVRTVESHVSSLLRKLGAADRRELAKRAASSPLRIAGLPVVRTSFVGRDGDMSTVLDALAVRALITLVGPGGVGKTRLAVEVANSAPSSFPFGGAFVDLVPVSAGHLVQAVAAALGVIERSDRTLEGAIHERLRTGRRLLVLDNCEHVLAAAARFAARALATCPDLVILATSREGLGVAGERAVQIHALPVGAATGEERSDAEQLFEDRIADPSFHVDPEDVRLICRRVDGLPLAIELAAARATSMGTDGLVRGLDDHLGLLATTGGSSERHSSLRTVIDWSHSLLSDEERVVFRRLGTFQSGFDLDAVTAVAAEGDASRTAHLVGRLVEQSLLTRDQHTSRSRWTMLETLRSYAREQLNLSPDGPGTANRYFAWAALEAAELEAMLDADNGWVERFDFVIDDLRAALDAPQDSVPTSEAHRLACTLGHLTYARGFLAEAQGHYESAADFVPDSVEASSALASAAHVARANMRADLAFDLLLRAADQGSDAVRAISLADAVALAGRFPGLFAEAVDPRRLTSTLEQAKLIAPSHDPMVKSHVLIAAAWNAWRDADPELGVLAEAALTAARSIDDPVLISAALDAVAVDSLEEGRHKEAARIGVERLALLPRLPRHLPAVGGEVVDIVHGASDLAMTTGELQTAVDYAAVVRRELGDRGIPHMVSSHFVPPLVLQGRFDEADAEADLMVGEWTRAGSPPAAWMAAAVYAASMGYALRRRDDRADEWRTLAHTLGDEIRGFPQFADLRVALYRGDPSSNPPYAASGDYDLFARAVATEIAVVNGSNDAWRLVDEAMDVTSENPWAAACSMRAAGRMSGDRSMLEASLARWESIGARFEWACTLTLLPDRADEGISALDELGCEPPAV